MKKQIASILIGTSIIILASCNNENSETTEDTSIENEAENNALGEELQLKLDLIISNNLLVPMSIISDLKEDGKSLYHPEYVNSLDNISDYTDKFSQALNFGIYGVDIIYNIAHDHTQEIMDYRAATLPVAVDLGLESFYNEEDMEAFKAATGDDAQLSQFIFNEYHKIDEFMVSHKNFETATLVLCGGIIESMSFTGRAIEEYGLSEKKYSLLLNERNTLGQLIELLGYFENFEKDKALKADMQVVYDAFNAFTSQEDLTDEKIREMDKLVLALRDKIVNNEF